MNDSDRPLAAPSADYEWHSICTTCGFEDPNDDTVEEDCWHPFWHLVRVPARIDGPVECVCPESHGSYNTPSGLRNCKECHGLLGKAR